MSSYNYGFLSIALTLITVMELTAGGLLAYGVVYAITDQTTMMIFNGLLISSFTLIALFFGQRLAKDYDGAATIVLYFILTDDEPPNAGDTVVV